MCVRVHVHVRVFGERNTHTHISSLLERETAKKKPFYASAAPRADAAYPIDIALLIWLANQRHRTTHIVGAN